MADLLIKNGTVFTYIHEGYHALKLRRADVLVENGVISKIAAEINTDCEQLEAEGCMLLPGYINAGADVIGQAVLAGLLADIAAPRQKERAAGVVKIAYEMLDDDELRAIALLGLWDNIRSGVTTVLDTCGERGHSPVKSAAEALGIRPFTAADIAVKYLAADCDIRAASDSGELVGAAVYALNKPSVATRELMHSAGATALLSAVGCAQSGENFPVVDYLRGGVNSALATGVWGNSMLAEMRTAALTAKQSEQNPRQYKATDAFYAATVAGAQLIGMEGQLGRIDLGMAGDISAVSMKRFSALSYPFNQYLYSGAEEDTQHIVRGGKILMKNGAAPKNAARELTEAREVAARAVLRCWERARLEVL